jgi:DNA-binding response OmpR family regulator
MLVEDDPAIRMVLRVALEDAGYEVLEADTGEKALVMAIDEAADVLLVDLRLPGIHGLDVVRTVRGASRVPIIILTAQTESHDIVAGLQAGADDYVTKPFVTEVLLARIGAQIAAGATVDAEAGLECGPLVLSPDLGVLHVNGTAVPLAHRVQGDAGSWWRGAGLSGPPAQASGATSTRVTDASWTTSSTG